MPRPADTSEHSRFLRAVGYWSHARRKFDEALNALPPDQRKGTAALTGLEYCKLKPPGWYLFQPDSLLYATALDGYLSGMAAFSNQTAIMEVDGGQRDIILILI